MAKDKEVIRNLVCDLIDRRQKLESELAKVNLQIEALTRRYYAGTM